MKIKVESEKIVKAVKKLSGIEVVLENPEDAREAVQLVLAKPGVFKSPYIDRLKEVRVTSSHEYKSSAVDYKLLFLLEFLFDDGTPLEVRASIIQELQEIFNKP
jgi:hypothetical protein